MLVGLTTHGSPRAGLLGSVVWKDERNTANHAELLDYATRSTERQVDRMARIMPLFPDAPEILLRSWSPWAPERRIVCPDEHVLVSELRRLDGGGGLAGHKAESGRERPETPRCDNRCPTRICGPDMTAHVVKAIERTKEEFAKWKAYEEKSDKTRASGACEALDSIYPQMDGQPLASKSWDILQFFDKTWLEDYYAVGCADQNCYESVQINDGCHYAGSVNYVIFGVMCKLCGMADTKMYDLIWAYKGERTKYRSMLLGAVSGVRPFDRSGYFDSLHERIKNFSMAEAKNYNESQAWAWAGYRGWPLGKGVKTPPGDKPGCACACPNRFPYPGQQARGKYRFGVTWAWVDHSKWFNPRAISATFYNDGNP
jgi:hypothetical protein